MARFRCCGNYSTEGHAKDCSLAPPKQTLEEREKDEEGCQFDILNFKHLGECKGTCDGGDDTISFLEDEDQETGKITIVLIAIDPDDEEQRKKLQELEERGILRRLSDGEMKEIIEKHDRGDMKVNVSTKTVDEIAWESREEDEDPPEDEDPFLTVNEAAEALGFSLGWTRTLCRMGRLPGAIKLMRRWAIPRSAIYTEEGEE